MRIAVCVKHVPEGPSRLDSQTFRLDRSGEGAVRKHGVYKVSRTFVKDVLALRQRM